MFSRFSLISASFFGLTGVALGAFGAHALQETLLVRGTLHAWNTGVLYQLLHAVALIGIAGCAQVTPNAIQQRYMAWVGRFWVVGIVLFSGSLYVLALGGPRIFGPITPFGGLALMLGWMTLLIVGIKHAKD